MVRRPQRGRLGRRMGAVGRAVAAEYGRGRRGTGGRRCRQRLQVAGVTHPVVVRIGLVGVENRWAVVEDVGDLVPVLVLQRMDEEIRPTSRTGRAVGAGTRRTRPAICRGPAHPVLELAGASVAELAWRAAGGGRAGGPDFDAVARPREHRGAAIVLDERTRQAVEVLVAHIARGCRITTGRGVVAVGVARTWRRELLVATPLARLAENGLAELPGRAGHRVRRVTCRA